MLPYLGRPAALRLPCIAVSRPAHGCREHVHPPPIINLSKTITIGTYVDIDVSVYDNGCARIPPVCTSPVKRWVPTYVGTISNTLTPSADGGSHSMF